MKTQRLLSIFFAILANAFIFHCIAATRFSVANGDWDNTAIWSATSGGPGGASIPTSADVVTINTTVTIPVGYSASCASMTISKNIAVTNKGTLTIVGSLTANLS